MSRLLSTTFLTALLTSSSLATPTPVDKTPAKVLQARQDSKITDSSQLAAAISSFPADLASIAAGISVGEAILTNIVPAPGPSSIPQLASEFSQIISPDNPANIFESGAKILLNGFAGADYLNLLNSYLLASNTNNINLLPPAKPIYPKASAADAPYSLSETDLRKAIYIPPGFTYGRAAPPVIFLPGTAALAGQNFGPNYGKLLKDRKVGDPVYVNIPNENLGDIQLAAEYAAYAVNYISGISGGRNVSTISWSAGSLDGQWALKYWPSNRQHLSNAIRISPDHHGTILAQLLCPGFETPGCTPAIAQQNYNSTFIATLRNNGGDSAYVPTTNIYSIFDEIVEPQQDPNASGALNDIRGVGVSNVELQEICTAALPGGTPNNDHEGVLYNALAYALAIDALTHPNSPGKVERVDAQAECAKFAVDGLSLADVLATHALIPLAVGNVLAFQPKVAQEPPIRGYARKDIPG
ncbi:alpha/beta-hydrolase [Hortaea werneckii]|nr:alpha/beta-hydrolase [Hortaea werneckii]KAI6985730.1 alpha/beta-hydrolase [Hortaea werneckii]KAI7140440.1 alpha/beta-hydrolase [Hortaea werneckii]KAI7166454.1 alpha/beta-hydrolase [Hortaea werneckii]